MPHLIGKIGLFIFWKSSNKLCYIQGKSKVFKTGDFHFGLSGLYRQMFIPAEWKRFNSGRELCNFWLTDSAITPWINLIFKLILKKKLKDIKSQGGDRFFEGVKNRLPPSRILIGRREGFRFSRMCGQQQLSGQLRVCQI